MELFTRPDGSSFTSAEVLAVPLGDNPAGASDVRDYLAALVHQLWIYEEGFTGKRPFGSEAWKGEVYSALVRDGFVAGSVDDDGMVHDLDRRAAEAVMLAAIDTLGESG